MLHGDILSERASLSPMKTAILCAQGQRLTYRDLNQRAIQCAHLFLDHCRLSKSDRVAILAKNRLEFLDAFFAAGKSGVILVPLNVRQTAPELSAILKSSGAKAIFYDGDLSSKIRQLKQDPDLAQQIATWIALDSASSDLRSNDSASNDSPSALADPDYNKLRTSYSTTWLSPPCDPEDIYCLLYTSGTTGKPKGVMIPHRMVAWNACNTALNWQLRDTDVSPVFTPLYHAGGLFAFLTPIFAAGGTIVLHREFDAGEVWRTVEREKCTVMLGVPTIYKMLLEAPEFAQVNLVHVRWFISGGAPLPIELVDAYRQRGVILKQGYGLTEVGVNCFSMSEEDALRKAGSIGRPMMFTEAKLAGAMGDAISPEEKDDSQPEDSLQKDNCAENAQLGELCLRGPHVSKGYWQDPAATAAVLDANGWFHTGDIARRDPEGFFYIVGRSKDMFISGGVNVYPAEIEAELLRHPAVADAAVIGVPHPTWGEVGVAFLVLKPNVPFANAALSPAATSRTGPSPTPPSPENLTAYLAAKLAKYKLPKEFLFVESLPRTAYGKVLKFELQAKYANPELKK
jgi:fatty-acyl-CoA synthase